MYFSTIQSLVTFSKRIFTVSLGYQNPGSSGGNALSNNIIKTIL